jgi:hypothetical protein
MLHYRNVKGRDFPFSDLFEHANLNPVHAREYRMELDLDNFFFRAFAMLRMNMVEGDYLEFGCGSNMRSFRFALKYARLEAFRDRMLVAYDSFAGLPKPVAGDAHPQWKEGSMAVSEEQFAAVLACYHAKKDRDYRTVPGFYDKTIAGRSPVEHGVQKAAFVFVDCDLYSSTVPVLDYVTSALQDGSLLAFDDWFCLNADRARGEQRAFHEWRERTAAVINVAPYQPFGWHGMSFIVNRL